MTKPKISIIIPVYNTEPYLKKCLQSLFNQTFDDFEIICIDDGSGDKSTEIIRDYQKEYSNLRLREQTHAGVGSARNLGLELAQGKYLLFLDSDDWFEPNMLKTLCDTAEKNDTEILVFSAKNFDRTGKRLPDNDCWPINSHLAQYDIVFNRKDCPDTIFDIYAPEPWAAFYKKSFVNKHNLHFSDISSSNGVDFSFKARLLAERIMILRSQFVNYLVKRPDSITFKTNYMNMVKARYELKSFLIENDLYDKVGKSYWANIKRIIRFIRNSVDTTTAAQYQKQIELLLADDLNEVKEIFENSRMNREEFLRSIGDKKVVLWGASLFLKNLINDFDIKAENILGIIDKDPAKKGAFIGDYKIYAPEELKNLNPEKVVITVLNHSKEASDKIREYLKEQGLERVETTLLR